MPAGRSVLLCVVGSLLLASSAGALSITVVGNDGGSGIPGLDGGPGDPADAVASSDDAANDATAIGGRGGDGGSGGAPSSGGSGGAASARAETNVAAPASAIATATGGDGGNAVGVGEVAGDGGAATAEASAHGAGGSEARAIATGGNGGNGTIGAFGGSGGDAVLIDAVSGSDATVLVLEQRATGGGVDGDAVSTGTFENTAGGDLLVQLLAIGAAAQVGGSATSHDAGDAALEAVIRARGALTIDALVADATGTGNASASLEAESLAEGGSLSLTNRVDASAAGGAALALRQTVKAEAASESILDVTKSVALLELEANAEGGDAAILVRGSNDAGDVRLAGQAIGGEDPGAAPLDAVAEFEAHTTGDGHDIEIGTSSRPAGAIGGAGSQRPTVRGGHAEVLATGVALGNSAVRVDVVAEGGDDDDGIVGGNATTHAEGSGGGTEAVDVTATAIGGGSPFIGIGGNAVAEALASGLGSVSARAIAIGGSHYEARRPLGGEAFARAGASGASGSAEAVASTTVLFDSAEADDEQPIPITVGLAATLAGDVAVAASSRQGEFRAGTEAPDLDGFVRSAYHADAALLAAALAGNPLASAGPLANPADQAFALVELGLRSGGGAARTFTASIVLGRDGSNVFEDLDPMPEGVLISFLDPEIDATAFGSLTVRSWDVRNPGDAYEIVFASALDALAFFDDGRLVFGGLPRQRHLELVFETTGAEGELFVDFLIAAVPEPVAGALLVLAAVGLRRRSATSTP